MPFFTTEALDGMFLTGQEEQYVENEVPQEANPEIRK